MRINTAGLHRSPGIRVGACPVPAVLLLAVVIFSSCELPQAAPRGSLGSLRMTVDSGDPEGGQMPPVTYRFSGTGPGGAEFMTSADGPAAAVNGLVPGEWTVLAEGLNENGTVLLSGETRISVESYGETRGDILLHPVPGFGGISVSVSWNGLHTVDPSVTVIVEGPGGEETTTVLGPALPGTAAGVMENLPTGIYLVTVQLFDSGLPVAGSARTLRVYRETNREVAASFENLNKVGMPIEITGGRFDIAWDPVPECGPGAEYRVYFRQRGEYLWNLLGTAEACPDPRFTVTNDLLPYGFWEFAVSVLDNGEESGLHTSMDDDAQPGTGWYVAWTGP